MTTAATPTHLTTHDRVRLPAALPADAAEWGPEDLSLLTPHLGAVGRVVSTAEADPEYPGWTPMAEVAVPGEPDSWFWPQSCLTRLPDPWAGLAAVPGADTEDQAFADLARELQLFVLDEVGRESLHSLARRVELTEVGGRHGGTLRLRVPLPAVAAVAAFERAVAAHAGDAYTGDHPGNDAVYAYLATHPDAFARDWTANDAGGE